MAPANGSSARSPPTTRPIHTLVSKNGGWSGVMTLVRMIAERKLGIVVLINLSPQQVSGPAAPAKLDQTIFSALLPALGAQP